MHRLAHLSLLLAASQLIASVPSCAQTAHTPPQSTTPAQPQNQAQSGGVIRGTVKSGSVPLPGVTVTAQNTLTGKTYYAATNAAGAYSLAIPQNGRYVVRTQFAAFAEATHEALLNATGRDRLLDFDLILASRAQQQQQREERA